MPSDIVLFGGDILGKGGQFGKSLIIRFSGEEDILAGKIISREEAKMGKYVVFGAKSHHIIINFWENTLYNNSCYKNLGKPPRKPLFSKISDKY